MRQSHAVVLFALVASLVCMTPPASAQHGAAHGGGGHASAPSGHFSAPSSGFHSAPAPHAPSGFRGGFNSTPSSRFNGAPRSFGSIRPGVPTNYRSPGYRSPNFARPTYPIQGRGNDRFRQPYRGSGGDRDRDHDRDHHHRYGYGYWNSPYAIPYVYPYYGYNGWLDSGFYDDSADNGYDNNYVTNQAYSGSDYDQGDPNYGPPYPDQAPDDDPSGPPYPGAYPNQHYSPRPEYTSPSVPMSQSSVTLVFKDGRPSEQVHNYLLSRSTLTVFDQGRHDIPVDQLDLAATEKANREAGIDFHLPASD